MQRDRAASPLSTPPAATAARGPPGAWRFLFLRQISTPRRTSPASRFARRRRAAARRTIEYGAPTRGSPSGRPNGRTRRRRRLHWCRSRPWRGTSSARRRARACGRPRSRRAPRRRLRVMMREGGPAPTTRKKKREVLGKVLSSESSVLCRTFCRIGEPTADRLRTVFTKCKTGRRSHTGRGLVEEELRAVLGGRRRRDVDDGGRVCGGGEARDGGAATAYSRARADGRGDL